MTGSRITARFQKLRQEGRAGLVCFVTAGDPDLETSLKIIKGLPKAGADIIELGMPFSDPMADGPAIQASSLRALAAGSSLRATLDLARQFRLEDAETPLVLMGYYNPIHRMGVPAFLDAAKQAGIDGLIIVDLPPEEDDELCVPAKAAGLDFIRLATPTTDAKRLPTVLNRTSGFLYYVSIAGITGTKEIDVSAVTGNLARIRTQTDIPIGVGFGIRSAEQAAAVARVADAAVVGTSLVETIRGALDASGKATPGLVTKLLDFVAELSRGVKTARNG